jgi:hypothetical protein
MISACITVRVLLVYNSLSPYYCMNAAGVQWFLPTLLY